jgi:hypothetical protein
LAKLKALGSDALARSINLVKLLALRKPAGLALKSLLVPDERIEARHPRAVTAIVVARNPCAAKRVLENITVRPSICGRPIGCPLVSLLPSL